MEPLRGISRTWLAVWRAAAGVLLEDPVERDEELTGEVQRPHRVRHRRVERHQDERPANRRMHRSAGRFPTLDSPGSCSALSGFHAVLNSLAFIRAYPLL